MRTGIVGGAAAWVGLSVIGGVIVAVPDEAPRLFSMSETHGPSALDLVGIGVLLLGWAVYLAALWRHRRAVRAPRWLAVVAAAGAAVIAWSVVTDTGIWWVLGAAVLVAAQVAAGLSAAASGDPVGAPDR